MQVQMLAKKRRACESSAMPQKMKRDSSVMPQYVKCEAICTVHGSREREY